MRNSLLLSSVLAFSLLAAPVAAQTKAPGKGLDACSVVSKAELEQALGAQLQNAVVNPKMQNAGILSNCDYPTGNGGQVSVLLRKSATKFVPGTEKEAFEKQGMKPRYITGLGTTAFFTNMYGVVTSLSIFRGDYDYVQVSATSLGGDAKKTEAGLEKIGRLVLDRWK